MNETPIWHSRRSVDPIRPDDQRNPFERDRARILHSAAFRRLQAKTQIQGVGQNDFYRTRLTHSLEVSQIGSGLLPQLALSSLPLGPEWPLDERLIESVCLAHDIGHPPFGHGGEVALNYLMRDHGGFEGNGQTLRILAVLEPYTEHYGMNLTRRTLLGLLKYPNTLNRLRKSELPAHTDQRMVVASQWKPCKGVFDDDQAILDWILAPLNPDDRQLFQSIRAGKGPHHHGRTQYKSIDASIMELADDIAYGVHDLEDAIVVGNISKALWFDFAIPQFNALEDHKSRKMMTQISEKLFSAHHLRKEAIGQLVNNLITSVTWYQTHPDFCLPLLRYNVQLLAPQQQILDILKKFVYQHVIRQPEIQQVTFKGQKIVMALFDAFASDPLRLLPHNTQQRWKTARDQGRDPKRVICDYIAGMTDEYATRMFHKLL